MCEGCKYCQIKEKLGMVCNQVEDYPEFYKDTKQVTLCTAREPRK